MWKNVDKLSLLITFPSIKFSRIKMLSIVKQKGGDEEILLRMKNGYDFASRLLTEYDYVFRIINRKHRMKEINCYWYNCLPNGKYSLLCTVRTQFLHGVILGLC